MRVGGVLRGVDAAELCGDGRCLGGNRPTFATIASSGDVPLEDPGLVRIRSGDGDLVSRLAGGGVDGTVDKEFTRDLDGVSL